MYRLKLPTARKGYDGDSYPYIDIKILEIKGLVPSDDIFDLLTVEYIGDPITNIRVSYDFSLTFICHFYKISGTRRIVLTNSSFAPINRKVYLPRSILLGDEQGNINDGLLVVDALRLINDYLYPESSVYDPDVLRYEFADSNTLELARNAADTNEFVNMIPPLLINEGGPDFAGLTVVNE
jgi:hypothetical protein